MAGLFFLRTYFSRKCQVSALLVMLLLPAVEQSVAADVFPTRPLRMLVGYPAGGPNDITARITAEYLSGVLGSR